jgi:hypothetical protein
MTANALVAQWSARWCAKRPVGSSTPGLAPVFVSREIFSRIVSCRSGHLRGAAVGITMCPSFTSLVEACMLRCIGCSV